MRILVIQPTGDKRGHYGIYTVKLCHALGRLGHGVTLCTNKAHVARYLREAPDFRLWEVGDGKLAFDRFDAAINRSALQYYWGYFRNSYAVTAAGIGLSRREHFDAIAIMDTEFMTASLLLRGHRRFIPPVVMFLWASNFSFAAYPGSVFKRAYKVLQRAVFKKALGSGITALAVLDEWHREKLRPQLRLPAEFPIAVIPDGGGQSPDMPEKLAARQALGLDTQGPVFLFFGIIRRDKGIEGLLEAMSDLSSHSEQFTLVIAGWPMEYTANEVVQMVNQRRLGNKVVLRLGYVPEQEVPVYFAASDALVLPYTRAYTGGSGPLMKGACTFGRPVIATRVSGMGELVDQHRIGLLAEPENPRSMVATMKEFLALSENEREAMARNAAVLAATNSWEMLASRLIALVKQLVAHG